MGKNKINSDSEKILTSLGNCVNMQISAAVTETSIFFNILAIMHYIISKIVSTRMFSLSKNVL